MANALFAYSDVRAAQRAARQLAGRLPSNAVAIHAKDRPGDDTMLDEADEVVSGGYFRNLVDLWRGAFEWGESPHESSEFEETVRNGGAVVSVDTNTTDEQRKVDESMQDTGFERRTDWKISTP